MEKFYKVTKSQADLLGRFEYEKNHAFDPYCSEQKDGTYLVSEKMYEILKQHPKFTSVDFSKISKIDESGKDTKEDSLPDKIIKGK